MYYENELGYLNLLKDTINQGESVKTRNGTTISKFGSLLKFTNIENLPVITTKKIFLRGIIEELLWFLKGSYMATTLQEKNIHIWDCNSSREFLDNNNFKEYKTGELGPIYGWQWRNFGKKYKKEGSETGIDQIKYIIVELLKENNSRRAVLSGWNPLQLEEMVLPPCHILYNFYTNSKGLSCLLTLRSTDLFLGLPFNLTSTAILTHIIAKVLHLKTDEIAIAITDGHIYEEHIDSVNKQLNNKIIENNVKLEINIEPQELDSSIEEKINWINNLKYENFKILNYNSCEKITAVMK